MASMILIKLLQKRWFELAVKENFPNTSDITEELDVLEEDIKKKMTE